MFEKLLGEMDRKKIAGEHEGWAPDLAYWAPGGTGWWTEKHGRFLP